MSGGDYCFPLMRRAWCFQERLLATRVLHYTKSEIVFECKSAAHCECSEINRVTSRDGKSKLGRLRMGMPLGEETPSSANSLEHTMANMSLSSCLAPWLDQKRANSDKNDSKASVWNSIVGDYAKRALTYSRDTLPALSGVALKMQTCGMGKYLAGLWEQDLANGLMWSSFRGWDCERHSTYIAPTFSWALRVSPVTPAPTREAMGNQCVEILDCNCTIKGANPFGEVSSGYVKLRGKIIEAKFELDRWPNRQPPYLLNSVVKPVSSSEIWMGGWQSQFEIDTKEDLASTQGGTVYCLLMFSQELTSPISGVELYEKALMLKSTETPGVFQRCGTCRFRVNRRRSKRSSWFEGAEEAEISII
ncbi:uncharacterized protein PV07_02055 [Cladophialophora immunda]|uniref:Heterokaryon incompatibility domain-containing protein n=1 Tax=Cladophialophora immunda TaxID=569365 RepID=A0A0D2CZE7_9EURO|nr:uncharacterized protein PV07_02055 [Cladophialophora immunda]KIW35355.1 hypothetical protein PV07_02055 [Cladophialophora immunda]